MARITCILAGRLIPVLGTALLLAALGCREDAEPPTAPEPGPTLDIVPAPALSFSQLSAGSAHTCGLTTDNLAYCWGYGGTGALGNGTTTSHSSPTAVAGGLVFRQVSAGSGHTCGVSTDNRVYCWGLNDRGQLGDGTLTGRLRPVAVAREVRFFQVTAGFRHSCGVATDGRAFCWGANSLGQLGIGTLGRRLRPAEVAGGLRFRQVNAGSSGHTCGVTTENVAYCWGRNDFGQLGDGTTTLRRLGPVPVAGGLQFRLVDAGGFYTCGVALNELTYCWGWNGTGQLGIGIEDPGPHPRPQRVHAGGLRFVLVRSAGFHTCGVTTGDRAYCWGDNSAGQLGEGTSGGTRLTPVPVAGGLEFSGVTVGGSHTCGRTTDLQAYCWGNNAVGQLGDGTTITPRLTPVPVAPPGP
jgi:alpha-tubulin suppressor-like RCC1 family protein